MAGVGGRLPIENPIAAHHGFLADSAEKGKRLIQNGIPLRKNHAAVEPFAVRDDFEVVERFRVRVDEAR